MEIKLNNINDLKMFGKVKDVSGKFVPCEIVKIDKKNNAVALWLTLMGKKVYFGASKDLKLSDVIDIYIQVPNPVNTPINKV